MSAIPPMSGVKRTSGERTDIEARDPTPPSSSSQQHACEGITDRVIGSQQVRRNHLISSVSLQTGGLSNGRTRACYECNAADRENCEGEKSGSRFVNGHFR